MKKKHYRKVDVIDPMVLAEMVASEAGAQNVKEESQDDLKRDIEWELLSLLQEGLI